MATLLTIFASARGYLYDRLADKPDPTASTNAIGKPPNEIAARALPDFVLPDWIQ